MITLVGSSTVTVTAIEARTAIDSAAPDPIYWADPYITVQDDVDGIWDPIAQRRLLLLQVRLCLVVLIHLAYNSGYSC